MKLNLSENPREWQKFVLGLALSASLVAALLRFRNRITTETCLLILGLGLLLLVLALWKPRGFRRLYRGGMTFLHGVGRILSPVVLALMFLLVLAPLGLLLRLIGKDFLSLKRPPAGASNWHPARASKDFERMF